MGVEANLKIVCDLSTPMRPKATEQAAKLTAISNIRCVLFDVYGTLLISGSGDIGVLEERSRDDVFVDALGSVGLSCTREAGSRGGELMLQFIKDAHEKAKAKGVEYPEVEIRDIWRQTISEMQRAGLVSEEHEIHTEQIERCSIFYEASVNPVWPMPGMPDILEALSAKGLQLGIVSNAQFYTPLTIQALCGRGVNALGFDDALCVWSYRELQAKPGTVLFKRVLQKLSERGIKSDQVVYVGNDMLNDITAAQTAGCRTVLFAGDKRSLRLRANDPRCAGVVPDAIVDDLYQLNELFE